MDRPTEPPSDFVELPTRFGRVAGYPDDLITNQIRTFGNHTRPEFAFATSILQAHHKVFDLGAHIGTFSLAALQKLGPQARLLAVEGNPTTFTLLERNLSGRSEPKADRLNSFVGAGDGLAYVAVEGNSGAGHLAPSEGAGVDSASIDRLAESRFEPDYVKIDIEGFETAALRASEFVRRRKPILYLEINEKGLRQACSSHGELVALLSDLGYRFFRNAGERNAPHDIFVIEHVARPEDLPPFCDALCVQPETPAFRQLFRNARPAAELRKPADRRPAAAGTGTLAGIARRLLPRR
jgi:FkbM family methyltransferase